MTNSIDMLPGAPPYVHESPVRGAQISATDGVLTLVITRDGTAAPTMRLGCDAAAGDGRRFVVVLACMLVAIPAVGLVLSAVAS